MNCRRCILLVPAMLALLSSGCSPTQLLRFSQAVETITAAPSASTQPRRAPIPTEALARYQQIPDADIWLTELYEHQNFEKVETHIQENLRKDRQDELASAYLGRVYHTLGSLPGNDTNHTPEDGQAFVKRLAVLDQWVQRSPESHIPLLVRGSLLIEYGWELRSGKYASQVSAEDWEYFYKYLKQAHTDLVEAAQINPGDPNIWEHLIIIANSASLPDDVLEAYYQKGLESNPYHAGIRAAKMTSLYPNWGGSWKKTLAFAEQCRDDARVADKPLLGSVFLLAARKLKRESRNKNNADLASLISWSEVKDVYEYIFAKYPDYLRMRYYYADDASIHEQYATALEQFEQIGDRWTTGLSWDDQEEYHRVRASTTYRVAYQMYEQGYEQFKQGNQKEANVLAKKSKALTLKSVALWPQAGPYLLLASLSGNVDQDFAQTVAFAEKALASQPNEVERKSAEEMIHKAQQMLN